MRNLFLAILISLLPLITRAADAPSKPDELKVLDKLIGEWTTETTVTNLGGEAQNIQLTGVGTRKWSVDGRIVEEDASNSKGEKTKVIFTYDTRLKAYRWFYFSGDGVVGDFTGQWNEATQTLTCHADFGNGVTQVAILHFTDNDHHDWNSKVTDANGKVWFEGSGKVTRKK